MTTSQPDPRFKSVQPRPCLFTGTDVFVNSPFEKEFLPCDLTLPLLVGAAWLNSSNCCKARKCSRHLLQNILQDSSYRGDFFRAQECPLMPLPLNASSKSSSAETSPSPSPASCLSCKITGTASLLLLATVVASARPNATSRGHR